MSNFITVGGKNVILTPLQDVIAIGYKPDTDEHTVRSFVASKSELAAPESIVESIPKHRLILVTKRPSSKTLRIEDVKSAVKDNPSVDYVSTAFVERQTGSIMIFTNDIIIRFKEGVDKQSIENILRQFNLTLVKKDDVGQYRVKITTGNGTQAINMANELAKLPEVKWAEPYAITEIKKHSFDPSNAKYFDRQWHLQNSGQGNGLEEEDVDALQAWKIILGGSPSIVVAILDDGVDLSHPDLKDNIDPHGFNFVDQTNDPNPKYFKFPYDRLEGNDIHGTPCAGVAAASGNGALGIAFRCKILPIKVFGGDNLVPTEQVATSIRYAAQHADILSCSWSTGPSNLIADAIHDVATAGRNGRGCPIFVASGNNWQNPDRVSFPASLSESIAVGASTNQGTRAGYSMYGPELDFLAPSNGGSLGILTTDVSFSGRGFNIGQPGNMDEKYTAGFGGTSSATPLAAGVAALLLSADPNLLANDVLRILRDSCDKIDADNASYDQNGFSMTHGYGRINARHALDLLNESPASQEWKHYDSAPNIPIPDNDTVGVTDTIEIMDEGLIKDIKISTEINHTYVGDLLVTLTTPSGSLIKLHEFTGATQRDLHKEFTMTNSPSLKNIIGESRRGLWRLNVCDYYSLDTGELKEWAISILPQNAVFVESRNSILIPDNSIEGATSIITLNGDGKIKKIKISVNITHSFAGDLRITLRSPTGKVAVLRDRTGGSLDNIQESYTLETSPEISKFIGEPISGNWTVKVEDAEKFDSGKLNGWSIVAEY